MARRVRRGRASPGVIAPSPPLGGVRQRPAASPARAHVCRRRAVATPPAASPPGTEPPSLDELGPIGWLRAKLAERPSARTARAALHDEPRRPPRPARPVDPRRPRGRRSSGLRMFRLAEPYQMHFDEVYHARTATEFLQDWRYGIAHDIYEWTHPHLAKYAMAGGHRGVRGTTGSTATSDLGVPVRDAAIEPRRDDATLPDGRAGDRVDVATGSELRSYDLADPRPRRRRCRSPGAGAVAFDCGRRPAVRRVDRRRDRDRRRRPRSTPPASARLRPRGVPEPIAFGRVDGQIKRLFVPDGGVSVLAVTSDDRVITLDATTAEVLGTVQLDSVQDIAPAGTGPTPRRDTRRRRGSGRRRPPDRLAPRRQGRDLRAAPRRDSGADRPRRDLRRRPTDRRPEGDRRRPAGRADDRVAAARSRSPTPRASR